MPKIKNQSVDLKDKIQDCLVRKAYEVFAKEFNINVITIVPIQVKVLHKPVINILKIGSLHQICPYTSLRITRKIVK